MNVLAYEHGKEGGVIKQTRSFILFNSPQIAKLIVVTASETIDFAFDG